MIDKHKSEEAHTTFNNAIQQAISKGWAAYF